MEKILATYKYYDERGRRLSIFAQYRKNKGVLEVMIFTCNKGDRFSKYKATTMYALASSTRPADLSRLKEIGIAPQEFYIACDEKETHKFFIEWCNKKYRKMHTQVHLLRGDIVDVKVRPAKMSEGRSNLRVVTTRTLW